MAKQLKNIKTFDEHTKKFSISDVMNMIPSEKESEKYANGSFGFDGNASYQEQAFVSGTDWMRLEIEKKLKDE